MRRCHIPPFLLDRGVKSEYLVFPSLSRETAAKERVDPFRPKPPAAAKEELASSATPPEAFSGESFGDAAEEDVSRFFLEGDFK